MRRLLRGSGVVAASVAAGVVLSACSVTTTDKPAVTPFNPLGPSETPTGTETSVPLPDIQLRPVSAIERTTPGQCGETPPPSPPPDEGATLCSADLVYVLTLGPAILDGEDVRSIDAGSLGRGPTVRVILDVNGSTALANATLRMSQQQSPGNLLAIVTDGRVQSAPAVTDQIDGGILDITGFESVQAAQQAARLIGG